MMHGGQSLVPSGGTGGVHLRRAVDAGDAAGEAPWQSEVDDAICAAAATPDNALLAVGSEGGEILLRELTSGGAERRLAGHRGGTMALSWVTPRASVAPGIDAWAAAAQLAYVRDGACAASGATRYGALCATYGVPPPAAADAGATRWVLVSSGADGHVRAWDGATGALLCSQPIGGEGSGITGGVSGSAGAWVMNVDTLPCTTANGQPAVRYMATVGRHVLTGVLVPGGSTTESGSESGGWAAEAAEAEALGPLDKTVDCNYRNPHRNSIPSHTSDRSHMCSIGGCFCSDGSVAACCYGGVAVWRPRAGLRNDQPTPRKFSYKGWLVRLAPSPDAVWIAGKCLTTRNPDRALIYRDVSDRLLVVAAGCNDNTVRLWRRATGQELQCGGYSSKITGLSWNSSSRYLATSGGNQVTIWDFSGKGPAGSTPICCIGLSAEVTCICFQPELPGQCTPSGTHPDDRIGLL